MGRPGRQFDAIFPIALTALLAFMAGCGRAPVASTPSTPAVEEATQPAETTAEVVAAVEEPAAQTETPTEEVVEVIEPERLIIFTPDGPLIVHLEIRIDGRPQRKLAERMVDAAMSAAGEGPITWSAWIDHPDGGGKYGYLNADDPAARKRLIDAYDTNKNSRVERDEMAALLARETGGGRPVTIQTTNVNQQQLGDQTTLFAVLDVNSDGWIDADEIAAAASRLHARDADDDDVVLPSDIRARSPRSTMDERPSLAPESASELTARKIRSIFYTLEELYAEGRGIRAASFALSPKLFTALDTDGNGRLDQREAAGLATAPPDLVLAVDFTAAGVKPIVKSTSQDLIELGLVIQEQSGRLNLSLPHWALETIATSTAARRVQRGNEAGDEYRMLRVQLRVGEVEDSLFGWLDENLDGRLTLREIEHAAPRLRELDKQADGKIEGEEVPKRLALTIARGLAVAPRDAPGMTPPPAVARPAENAPDWFTAMDQNADGAIGPREFLGNSRQFQQLDGNADGMVDAQEARAVEGKVSEPPPEEAADESTELD